MSSGNNHGAGTAEKSTAKHSSDQAQCGTGLHTRGVLVVYSKVLDSGRVDNAVGGLVVGLHGRHPLGHKRYPEHSGQCCHQLPHSSIPSVHLIVDGKINRLVCCRSTAGRFEVHFEMQSLRWPAHICRTLRKHVMLTGMIFVDRCKEIVATAKHQQSNNKRQIKRKTKNKHGAFRASTAPSPQARLSCSSQNAMRLDQATGCCRSCSDSQRTGCFGRCR